MINDNQIMRILLLNFIPLLIGCSSFFEPQNQKILQEMEKSLKIELLNAWYPITVDTVHGGYLSNFAYDWQPDGLQDKFLVSQARHVWTSSAVAMFYNDDHYRKIAEHGFHFLKDKMWDSKYGGFYLLRNRQGDSIQRNYGDNKSAYSNAFAIYALANYFVVSGDSSALELAQKTFFWLEKYSHDPEYKGYFDLMKQDGSRYEKTDAKLNRHQLFAAGLKDQNSSIHLLEAFTELYRVWPDTLLRERLVEMLTLIRDTITTEKGYLTLYLERDWTSVSFRDSSEEVRSANYMLDHVSFGHDVETAYLMLEASHVLGINPKTKTLAVAKKMVDHALATGWDDQNGGFYYQGYYLNNSDTITIIDNVKTWWVQDEGLNALLLMATLFPKEKKYKDAFKKQWAYMKKYLIDHQYGGWYTEGLDNSPDKQFTPKAYGWKVNYHDARALINCIKMLR